MVTHFVLNPHQDAHKQPAEKKKLFDGGFRDSWVDGLDVSWESWGDEVLSGL